MFFVELIRMDIYVGGDFVYLLINEIEYLWDDWDYDGFSKLG